MRIMTINALSSIVGLKLIDQFYVIFRCLSCLHVPTPVLESVGVSLCLEGVIYKSDLIVTTYDLLLIQAFKINDSISIYV